MAFESLHKAFSLTINGLKKTIIDGNMHQVDLLNQAPVLMTTEVTAAIALINSVTPQEPQGYKRTALKLICSYFGDSEKQDEHMDSTKGKHVVRGTYFCLPKVWDPNLVPLNVEPTMFKHPCVENDGLRNLKPNTKDFLLSNRWSSFRNVGPAEVVQGTSLQFRGSTIHCAPPFKRTKAGFFRAVIFEYLQPIGEKVEHTSADEYQVFEYFFHLGSHPNLFYANVRKGHPLYQQVLRHPTYEWLPPDGSTLRAKRWQQICAQNVGEVEGHCDLCNQLSPARIKLTF